MTRKRDYAIIRFLIASFFSLAVLFLVSGLASAVYLWLRAEAPREGSGAPWPLSGALSRYDSSDLCLGAAVLASAGLIGFLVLGAFGQALAMQRDRSINASLTVQLLEDILEQNEEAALSVQGTRGELCEGCGRLGSP